MSGDDRPFDDDRLWVCRRWLAVADLDVRSACACLDAREPIPETAAYHCQQAVEKLAKGLLVLAQTPFRKTHDLVALRNLVVASFPDLETSLDPLVSLTDWGHVFRYPDMGAEPVPSIAELRDILVRIRSFADLAKSCVDTAPSADSGSGSQC